jgi:hypothetical protein
MFPSKIPLGILKIVCNNTEKMLVKNTEKWKIIVASSS